MVAHKDCHQRKMPRRPYACRRRIAMDSNLSSLQDSPICWRRSRTWSNRDFALAATASRDDGEAIVMPGAYQCPSYDPSLSFGLIVGLTRVAHRIGARAHLCRCREPARKGRPPTRARACPLLVVKLNLRRPDPPNAPWQAITAHRTMKPSADPAAGEYENLWMSCRPTRGLSPAVSFRETAGPVQPRPRPPGKLHQRIAQTLKDAWLHSLTPTKRSSPINRLSVLHDHRRCYNPGQTGPSPKNKAGTSLKRSR